MPTTFAALLCHAPIVVPAVARDRAPLCRRTTRAMREVAARLVAAAPDRLVLVSPHSPRRAGRWSAWTGPHAGDLGEFGAPGVAVRLPDAPAVAEAIGAAPIAARPLDHGAMVPLAFLWEAGWRGPTAILALPAEGEGGDAVGRALARLPGATAVIASGDMSHRLKEGAPAGYSPRATRFDHAFVEALRRDDWAAALAAEPRQEAAEDVVDSTRVAMAAAGEARAAEVIAYEGPWGVGYTEAVLFDPTPPTWAVARRAATRALLGLPSRPLPGGGRSTGVFVTWRRDGELRGCIGHVSPVHDTLHEEIADVAVAALSDDRFPPVREEELPDLDVEVSLLQPPEPCAAEDLDPAVWGVIVTAGRRRGLLLPAIEGVTEADVQVAIARRKAGIGSWEEVSLQRFRVTKECPP